MKKVRTRIRKWMLNKDSVKVDAEQGQCKSGC